MPALIRAGGIAGPDGTTKDTSALFLTIHTHRFMRKRKLLRKMVLSTPQVQAQFPMGLMAQRLRNMASPYYI